MTWAHITAGQIDQTGPLPDTYFDGARWWDLRDGQADPADAGWEEVVETTRPADTATDTSDPSITLVDGVPTRVWTVRAWTADELAARAAQQVAQQMITDTTADLDKIMAAITSLATILGDETTDGSIKQIIGASGATAGTDTLRALRAQTNQDVTSAQSIKGLLSLLIDLCQLARTEAGATRRIARQTLRLARAYVGDDSSADVGPEIS